MMENAAKHNEWCAEREHERKQRERGALKDSFADPTQVVGEEARS